MWGSLGIELAMICISKARDHPKWTLDADKLLKLKLENILDAIIRAVQLVHLLAQFIHLIPPFQAVLKFNFASKQLDLLYVHD